MVDPKDACVMEFSGENKNVLNVLAFIERNSFYLKLQKRSLFTYTSIFLLLASFVLLKISQTKFFLAFWFLFSISVLILLSLFFLFFVMNKKRKILYEYSKLTDKKSNKSSFLKISKIFDNEITDILPAIININCYPKWNSSIERIESNSSQTKIFYNINKAFNKFRGGRRGRNICKDNFDMTFKRVRRNNQIFDVDEKTGRICRLIVIEELKSKPSQPKPNNQCRVRIFIPFEFISSRSLLERSQGLNFIRSEFESLASLHIYIRNEIFSKEMREINRRSVLLPRESLTQKILPLTEIKELIELEDKSKKNTIQSNKETTFEKDSSPREHQIVSLPESVNHEYSGFYQTLEEFKKKNWNVMEEKSDYKTFYFDEASGLRSIKAEAIVNKNYKSVFEYALRFDVRGQYDKNFENGKIVREIDGSNNIQYLKFKGKLMIEPRDFVTLCHTNCVIIFYFN